MTAGRPFFALLGTALISTGGQSAWCAGDELDALLGRLRSDSPAELQKVQRLAESDRASALRFLQERYGGSPSKTAPSKIPVEASKKTPAPPEKSGALLPGRGEQFEKIETIRVGDFSV